MVLFDELPAMPGWPDLQLHEAAVIAHRRHRPRSRCCCAKDRLTAIVSLGIQGFAVALLFLLFGAPDLSFTQFMVETLSVVILALVMTRLRLSPTRPPAARAEGCCDGDVARALRRRLRAAAAEGDAAAVRCRR